MTVWYKFLKPGGEAPYGTGSWHLPTGGKPARWMPVIEKLVPCERGYHVCERKDLLEWIQPCCFLVEVGGTGLHVPFKSVFGTARILKPTKLNEKALRLFAADCAQEYSKRINLERKESFQEEAYWIPRAFAFGLISYGRMRDTYWKICRNFGWQACYAESHAAATSLSKHVSAQGNKEWALTRLEDYIYGRVDFKPIKAATLTWMKQNGIKVEKNK